jgi:predicted RNA-binding protein with PIN domain
VAALILDGYNVIHRHASPGPTASAERMEAARAALLGDCAEWLSRRRDVQCVRIVYDSRKGGGPTVATPTPRNIDVIYTASGRTADDHIAATVRAAAAGTYTVVTDDRELSTRVAAMGANVWTVAEFYRRLRPRGHPPARAPARGRERGGSGSRGRGDKARLRPGEAREITDELRREWGLE